MKRLASAILCSSMFLIPLVGQTRPAPPAPEEMVQHRVKMLTTLLSLTSAQQQQATAIFTNAATTTSGVHASLRAAHQDLNVAVKSNDTAAIDRLAAQIGNSMAQLTSTEAKAKAAFYQILTPEQQTKLSQFQSEAHGGFHEGHGMEH